MSLLSLHSIMGSKNIDSPLKHRCRLSYTDVKYAKSVNTQQQQNNKTKNGAGN